MDLFKDKERFKQVIEYEPERPDFDANKDQKLFDIYMEKFEEAVNKHAIYKAKDAVQFEETGLDQVAQEAIELDDDENQGDGVFDKVQKHDHSDTIIHKTLLCSGSFSSDNWLLEARKTFYQGETGRLHLELAQFSLGGEKKSMGAQLLHTYENQAFNHLFNSNAECLFNHMQIHEKIYYFAIEKS